MTVLALRAPMGWLGPGRLTEEVVVVMAGGRIAYAGAANRFGVVASGAEGAESLAGDPLPPEPDEELFVDGFVLPGVVDRHVHIGLSDPGAVLAGGATAVRDLGWPAGDIFSLAEASEGPSFQGPLIRTSGPMITCHGGYPTRAAWAPDGTGRAVRGADEAAESARQLLERGAAIVKVALNSEAGPTLTDDELVAICDVAHDAETIVTAHVQGKGQAARALGAGIDEFAHCPWTERLPDDLIMAAAKRMRIVSTLDIHSYGDDTPELRLATENLARFVAAGGQVAYGTDLGNGPIPAGIHPGEAWHLHRAGLSPEGVLQAMTFRPLAPGELADLVVLARDPLENLDALADVRQVIRGGNPVR